VRKRPCLKAFITYAPVTDCSVNNQVRIAERYVTAKLAVKLAEEQGYGIDVFLNALLPAMAAVKNPTAILINLFSARS
jgi:hypothetical protein